MSNPTLTTLPLVTLDQTLADLFALDSDDGPHPSPRLAIVPCAASSDVAISSTFPRTRKYVCQDDLFMTNTCSTTEAELRETRQVATCRLVSLVAQRDGFIAGPGMGVVIFGDSYEKSATGRAMEDAEITIAVLADEQRARLVACEGPEVLNLEANGIDMLVMKVAADALETKPLTMPMEIFYFLNTKAALAESGIPTPASTLIQIEGLATEPLSCCTICQANKDELFIAEKCEGDRRKWIRKEVDRITNIIQKQHQPPFALKTQQSFGGGGTFLVHSESDKEELLKNLSTHLLPKLLISVTSANQHLLPATLVISHLVQSPNANIGFAFFVTKKGRPIFIGATTQTLANGHQWTGSRISYPQQQQLENKLTPIMQQIAKYLHRYGYYGPVGADVLESKPYQGSESVLEVVDLNVRIPASLMLGLLKKHYDKSRNMHEACSLMIKSRKTREQFIQALPKEFEDGRIIIAAWYRDESADGDGGISYASLVVGAEDAKRLDEEVEKVRCFSEETHF